MTNDIEFLKSENAKLHGETLALQWLLACLARGLDRSDAIPAGTIENAFNCADEVLTEIALRVGKQASPEHTSGAIRIVEQLRKQVFADN